MNYFRFQFIITIAGEVPSAVIPLTDRPTGYPAAPHESAETQRIIFEVT